MNTETQAASDFEFFILLAKLRSLSGAARALDLSPPAATKRLSVIEQRLGVRLVNRTTRSVSLTPEGETYLRHALQIVGQIREMEEEIAGATRDPQGLLRINATLGFGRTTIAPIVSEFVRKFPSVEVQFEVTDRPVDLIEGAFDMAIRFGELPDSRLSARRIMSNRRFLCASPKYLDRHGRPERVEDLANHRCIIHRQNDDAYGVWRYIVNDHIEAIKVKGALSSNDGDIVLRWALDGHGILIRSEWDLAKYLQSGRLHLVLPNTVLPSADLFVYYARQRNQTARARAFIDFLVSRFQAPFTPVDVGVDQRARKRRGPRGAKA
ncbi:MULTISPECIES: LysR family transcriptional regulator [unclassified Caballeronia]|uniref:LysR family transcriptional regulator n=1 Tax=unclassified Caballeronia TaxID=2646786 RepID=UPI002860B027|nr:MULTISPECIES: LysR family transcriptional regulator [unclassified Caballeronia]MDR5815951.1 LysR family transcriptional regulator [Caballeronia sp. LZ033]MDR5821848.1 LysR family transcriptional regulator [Caballeronia sp. LZ043]